jgi:hypothetical protein
MADNGLLRKVVLCLVVLLALVCAGHGALAQHATTAATPCARVCFDGVLDPKTC